MKRFALAAALISASMFAFDANAEPPGKEGGKRGKGKAGQGERPDGARRGGQGGAGQGGAGQGRPDATKMIAQMMKEFDKDGDQKLDLQELTAMMTAMRERRGGAGGGQGRPTRDGAGKGRPGGDAAGGRPDGARRGKRDGQGDGQADKGGARPKRPDAE